MNENGINEIRLQNLRSFKDSGYISIKKLTVLVGKNSVGKSTFLRLFPLLKQSLVTNRLKPIIWYSKELVDFGSFKDSILKDKGTVESVHRKIGFGFKMNIDNELVRYMHRRLIRRLQDSDRNQREITLNVRFDKDGELTVGYEVVGWKVKIKFINRGKGRLMDADIDVNGVSYTKCYRFVYEYASGELIPSLLDNSIYRNRSLHEFNGETILNGGVEQKINDEAMKLKVGRTSDKTINQIFTKFKGRLMTEDDFKKEFEKEIQGRKLMEKRYIKLNCDGKYIHNLYNLYGLIDVPIIIDVVNNHLNDYFQNIQYMGPVRATAQRYYRQQDLNVNEISPTGQNVPEMLASLNDKEIKEWQQWTKDNFKVDFKIKHLENNISVYLNEVDNDNGENLSDVGFGYSQILPILLYVWKLFYKNTKRHNTRFYTTPATLLIEQPELHLHPGFQASEMHALDNIISKSESNFNLIIETHSEYMIKQIGHDIANKILNPEDVSILVFDKDGKTSNSKIEQYKFTEDGFFDSWPIGFFEPNYL